MMKTIILGALLSLLAINASAYDYEIKGVKIDLSDKDMSYAEKSYYALSGHAPIIKEKPQEMYIDDDGHVRLTKTESGELSASDKMLMKWRAESAESEAAAKKLAKKPNAAIGMSKSQVRNKTNWGEPKYINTTTNRYGTHEQWVYDDYQYLYFDNGKLTTIQQ